MGGPMHITPVHGTGLVPELGDGVRELWAAHHVVPSPRVEVRLAKVSVVGTDDAGTVVAVATAFPEPVPHLAGRRLYVHRRFLRPGLGWEAELQLLAGAYDALEPDAPVGPDGEVGLFAPVLSEELARARPEAMWADTGFLHVGYGSDGGPQRVRYFEDATIA